MSSRRNALERHVVAADGLERVTLVIHNVILRKEVSTCRVRWENQPWPRNRRRLRATTSEEEEACIMGPPVAYTILRARLRRGAVAQPRYFNRENNIKVSISFGATG